MASIAVEFRHYIGPSGKDIAYLFFPWPLPPPRPRPGPVGQDFVFRPRLEPPGTPVPLPRPFRGLFVPLGFVLLLDMLSWYLHSPTAQRRPHIGYRFVFS